MVRTLKFARLVGDSNIFTFGLSSEEVLHYYQHGGYQSIEYYHHDSRIKQVVDQLVSAFFQMFLMNLSRFLIHYLQKMINTLCCGTLQHMLKSNSESEKLLKIGLIGKRRAYLILPRLATFRVIGQLRNMRMKFGGLNR